MALCKQVYKQAAGKREERQRDSEMVKDRKRIVGDEPSTWNSRKTLCANRLLRRKGLAHIWRNMSTNTKGEKRQFPVPPEAPIFPVQLPFPLPGHRTLKWIGGVSGGWEWQEGAFRGRQRRSRAFRVQGHGQAVKTTWRGEQRVSDQLEYK